MSFPILFEEKTKTLFILKSKKKLWVWKIVMVTLIFGVTPYTYVLMSQLLSKNQKFSPIEIVVSAFVNTLCFYSFAFAPIIILYSSELVFGYNQLKILEKKVYDFFKY
jgi:hypothetical protein